MRKLLDDMVETMHEAPGIGLAAIQIAEPIRLVVVDLAKKDEPPQPLQFINPEIVWSSDERSVYEEGCLSIPEYYEEVERPASVRARFVDRDGKPQEILAEGLLATVLQHEIDHLDGVLFIDHISKLKRDRVIKKFAKIAKRAADGSPALKGQDLVRLGARITCNASRYSVLARWGREWPPTGLPRAFRSRSGTERPPKRRAWPARAQKPRRRRARRRRAPTASSPWSRTMRPRARSGSGRTARWPGRSPARCGWSLSTLTPDWVRELAGHARAKGCGFLDAPVGGSRQAAASGELRLFVGGDSATLDRARPALVAIGNKIDLLGPAGAGATWKLINNQLIAAQVAALAEALDVARKAGFRPVQISSLILNGAALSPVVKLKLPRMLESDYDETDFGLSLMLKDAGYAVALAQALGTPADMISGAVNAFARAEAKGLGAKDFAAVAG